MKRMFLYILIASFILAFQYPNPSSVADEGEFLNSEGQGYELAGYPDLKVVINIPALRLTLIENGEEVKTYPIAVGQKIFPTSTLNENIKTIEWNPTWYPPPDAPWAKDEVVTPPGPNNPLGPVKMYIANGILVHGTKSPKSIGKAASHGCIRMFNEHAKDLAWDIQKKLSNQNDESLLEKYASNGRQTYKVSLEKPVPVEIIYNPIETYDNKLVLHKDIYNKLKDPETAIYEAISTLGYDYENLDIGKLFILIKSWKTDTLEVDIECLMIDSSEHCEQM